MISLRKYLTGLLVPLWLVLALIHPLAAAPIPQANEVNTYGITCKDGICSLRMRDAGLQIPPAVAWGSSLLFQVLQEHINLLPDGASLQITEDLTINTPAGLLDLLDTDLMLEVAPDNTLERMRGTARVPWPAWLGMGVGNGTLASATIGLEPGRDLSYLHLGTDVVLQPDRHYLYVQMGAGLRTDDNGAIVQEQLRAFDAPIPRGQYLTLLMDTTESALHLDGNVRLSLLEAWMTFDDFLQEQTGLPFELADEAISVHVSGQIGADVDAAFLEIGGIYTLEKRFVRSWLQTDTSPLAVNGALRLSREGVLLRGLTHSSIFPERVFDGEAHLEAFLPLDGHLWDAYIAAGGYAYLPTMALGTTGEERLTLGTLQPQVVALFDQATQLTDRAQPFFVVVTDTANDTVVHAARGLQVAGAAVGNGYQWAVDTVVDGATGTVTAVKAGFHSAQELATHSYQWTATLVTTGITTGASATADAAHESYVWTVTKVTSGSAAVGDSVASGYQATRDFTVDSYVWTIERGGTGVTVVGSWTGAGYASLTNGLAETVDAVRNLLRFSSWWGHE